MELKITIPLDPKSKKNKQNIVYAHGRPIIVQSEIYKKYEKACQPYIPKMVAPIDYPVNVQCVFYRETKRAVDLTNLLGAIDDILVKYGVLADDNRNILATHDGSVVYWDKENPRTEITITEKGDYEQWQTKSAKDESTRQTQSAR